MVVEDKWDRADGGDHDVDARQQSIDRRRARCCLQDQYHRPGTWRRVGRRLVLVLGGVEGRVWARMLLERGWWSWHGWCGWYGGETRCW